MSKASQDVALDARRDLPAESHPATNPELQADKLLKGAKDIFRVAKEKLSPVTPDGKQYQFPNIFANLHKYGNQADATPPPAADRKADAKEPTKDHAATLFDKNSTDEQKLSAVRELAKNGTTNLTYHDASGKERKLRLEVEQCKSGNEMVHAFADGKPALRGVRLPDGTWEHEQSRGHDVSFRGRGYSRLADGQPDTTSAKNKNPHESTPDNSKSPTDSHKPPAAPHAAKDSHAEPTPSKSKSQADSHEPSEVAKSFKAGEYKIDRSQFDSQLQDPKVMAAFAGRMRKEVGGQGAAAQLGFAEEVMNRAAARGQTLMEALSGGYYPSDSPGRSNNPEFIKAITKAWKQGTDTTNGATGNATGETGFGKRGGYYDNNDHWVSPNQTVRISGERFGYEQQDLDNGWLDKLAKLKRPHTGITT